MNVPIRERLGANVDSELVAALRDLAAREGWEIDGLIDEALADLIEKRRKTDARSHVLAAYQESHKNFASLCQKLAK
jgi:hypothetical protein